MAGSLSTSTSRPRTSKSISPKSPRTKPSSWSPITRIGPGLAADLLESKGFKIAGAIGAQVYESEGGTLVKYAPEKPAANAEK